GGAGLSHRRHVLGRVSGAVLLVGRSERVGHGCLVSVVGGTGAVVSAVGAARPVAPAQRRRDAFSGQAAGKSRGAVRQVPSRGGQRSEGGAGGGGGQAPGQRQRGE